MDEQERAQEEIRKDIAKLKEYLARTVRFLTKKTNNKEGPSSDDQNQDVSLPETTKFPLSFMPHYNNLPPLSNLNPLRGNPPLFGLQPFPHPLLGFQYPYHIPTFYFTTLGRPYG